MAKIVLGLGTSHSPQLSISASDWALLREKDERDARLDYPALLARAKPGIEREITDEKMSERYNACQKALVTLSDLLKQAKPDVIVIFGDDQHEQFHDDNMPTFAIYHGPTLPIINQPERNRVPWKATEVKGWEKTADEYTAGVELAEHLIKSLADQEFDVARSNRLRKGIGVGHAFAFLYRRLWPNHTPPVVPVMVNTYYPPNQPMPKRAYALGRAVRRSIESWEAGRRVAVMASGGLSHTVIDEELDRNIIDSMLKNDADRLYELPREKLRGGTSEILNWVALAGAADSLTMQLVDYVPCYRSPAGTGCGMAFAYWVEE